MSLSAKYAFDRAGEIGLAAGIHAPAAVGLLEIAQIVGDQRQLGIVFLIQDKRVQDVFGFKNAVALKLGTPVPFGGLFAEQTFTGPFDRRDPAAARLIA